jgi:uncharacterized protein YciI
MRRVLRMRRHGGRARPDAVRRQGPAPTVRYTLGLLVRGPSWTPERTPRTDSIQAGHMANIGRMWKHGALVAAGPFANGGELRGVFVFRPGEDPLDSLMAGDSAIATRRLLCQRYPWIGAPGFGDDYRHRTEERAKQGLPPQDSMLTFGWVMLQRGPKYDSNPSEKVMQLLQKHAAYTEELRKNGQLVFSGAVEGTGDLRGVLIMKGDSTEVARAMAGDPAVRAGRSRRASCVGGPRGGTCRATELGLQSPLPRGAVPLERFPLETLATGPTGAGQSRRNHERPRVAGTRTHVEDRAAGPGRTRRPAERRLRGSHATRGRAHAAPRCDRAAVRAGPARARRTRDHARQWSRTSRALRL